MQNAKDTFYITLRNRLAAQAPERVITLRALQRPAILVEEAEAPMGDLQNDCFVLRWSGEMLANYSAALLVSMTCELWYGSSGSQSNAGLDRGRSMSAMDALLLCMLRPHCALKMNYSTAPPIAMLTNVFWTTPVLGALRTVRGQLSRVATTVVFAYQEPEDQ